MNATFRSRQRGAGLLLLLIIFGSAAGYYAINSFSLASQQAALATTTSVSLSQAKEAVLGYAASHIDASNRPYLPCPDKTAAGGAGLAPNLPNDGIEDRTVAGDCVVVEGNLPWVTLGITGLDAWANRFRYRPTPAFANSTAGFTAATSGSLRVNNAAGAALDSGVPVPVVILSHGPNGWGATSSGGVVAAAPPGANVNETDNANGANAIYVSNAVVAAGLPGGEFDDVTVWISQATLLARMQPTGLVP